MDWGTCPPYFFSILKIFLEKQGRMAEWSALPPRVPGDSSSIPAEVKTFFGGIKSLEQYIYSRFELNFNFKLN